jgi:hypothetical protein
MAQLGAVEPAPGARVPPHIELVGFTGRLVPLKNKTGFRKDNGLVILDLNHRLAVLNPVPHAGPLFFTTNSNLAASGAHRIA